ncbi:TonB-dependent receptor plug domain-containing protein [Emcibacter sp.]|uniref:TonB-dependent receptor plug domain-containing protein n=1 Tax=Emcibacter sp. TaxID=1979954 RepID=UPI002AA74739|nr:TonB-dependent receptor [Emcibacter sp.]
MLSRNTINTAVLLAGTAISTVHAEEVTNIDEEIVVTATRYEKPLSAVGSSIDVLTDLDIQKRQDLFIQDILQNVSGLTLNGNGAFGGQSTIRIRGAASGQTVILIDGVQVNDASNVAGSYNFASLESNSIERIEVLKGPQSILYGSDAIGGVVNVITKSGTEGLGGSLSAEGGSYNTWRGSGLLQGGMDKLKFSLGLSGVTTNGISKADENDGNTEADGYWNYTLHGKVNAEVAPEFYTEIVGRYAKSRNEYDSWGPADGDEVGYGEEFLVRGKWTYAPSDWNLSQSVSIDYSENNSEVFSNGLFSYDSRGSRWNVDYFGVYKIDPSLTLSFGAQHEETKAETVSDRKFNIDSLVGEVSWQGLDGLTLTAGLRYDDHNVYGDTTTPRITASYYLAESSTKIFANWGEGFKAPTVFQLTYICTFCGLTEANPNLQPEESEGWEIGVEQNLYEDRIFVAATWFHQDITNMVDFSYTAGYDNIAEVETQGLELRLDGQVLDSLRLSANYTWTDATDRVSGEKLVRVPEHMIFGQVEWQPLEALTVALSATHNSEETDPYSPPVEAWTRVDFRAAYKLNDRIELYGRVDNLLDEEYQQIYGYGTPDRSFYIGARAGF